MTNEDFWTSIDRIISDGFTPDGLKILDKYAEQFISRRLIYKRFSPTEQHGCSEGGEIHVVASLLAAAKVGTDCILAPIGSFKREQQLAAIQEKRIEKWAKASNCWINDVDQFLISRFGEKLSQGGEAQVYDNGDTLIKAIGLDYYIQPLLLLDRISLHNAWFPETTLTVLGLGRTIEGNFIVIVEQPYIQGSKMTDRELLEFTTALGFKLINPRNWTYATSEIYLSDIHDENVIKSANGNIFVIDCDIRINIPELKCGGEREYSTEVYFH